MFGFKDYPSMLQSAQDSKFCHVYVDDVIILSKIEEEDQKLLRNNMKYEHIWDSPPRNVNLLNLN